jgi:hypothetical protein
MVYAACIDVDDGFGWCCLVEGGYVTAVLAGRPGTFILRVEK